MGRCSFFYRGYSCGWDGKLGATSSLSPTPLTQTQQNQVVNAFIPGVGTFLQNQGNS
jgi:hypothetical protein